MEREEIHAFLIRSLAKQMIPEGTIDPAGMSEAEFRAAFVAEAKVFLEVDASVHIVLDHQDSVLEQAEAFEQSGKEDFAIIFYATWIEHWLNGMVAWKIQRMGKPQIEATELIRTNTLKRKTGKVWREVFGEELEPELVTTILDIADSRNAFVHYKWQAMEEDELDRIKHQTSAVLARAQPLVHQLTALQHHMFFGDSYGLLDAL